MASRASKYTAVATASFDERRIERQLVTVTRARAGRRGKPPQDARLHDISIYGCRLLTGEEYPPATALFLQFGGSPPVPATVVWSDGTIAGCRFDTPIPGALVRAMTLAED